ncbi:hypothetical protein LEN26_000716 [Aphanomyces euteiches]|uniref:PARP-type domain-containing protein n=1 Tax=Aphanomyces euteiches TaxID=100861 RepID=A0A6G0WZS8_9STRA|nr:hypothetical protein Ae201684_009927 [Aphanomyces euteiches]KAH9096013.1 hypothetical protein Ae201684P_010217 [Aphanomyces euteiches]KAH9114688.1 hypothetical protein AeMF1_011239 [Aphanomyces euteiches]KAH9139897.1 hypothetical protein AeRB84_015834 [Aphanomyces euteiches]KAH9162967.1 hypothetical protein LEN26_000716 [Aphanomyces euteiches]
MCASSPWTKSDLPVISVAKQNSTTCQACHERIDVGSIRVGVVFHHVKGYICLDWHHLTCCETPAHLLGAADDLDLLDDKQKQTFQHFVHSQPSLCH